MAAAPECARARRSSVVPVRPTTAKFVPSTTRAELAPLRDFRKRVGAEDEEKLRRVPAIGVQRAQRLVGVGRAGAAQLDVAGAVPGGTVGRERDHREAMELRGARVGRRGAAARATA